jgi:integrase
MQVEILMPQLIYTDTTFRPEGNPSPGVPLLLDEEMCLIEPVCLWFFHIALVRGRTRSPNTWRSYAEAIYDWFQTCFFNNWQWDSVTEYHLSAYRNSMLFALSSYTGKPYAVRTVNGRLRRIAMFYKWALVRSYISTLPFEYEPVNIRGMADKKLLSHLNVSPNEIKTNNLTVRERAHYPKAIQPDQLKSIFQYLCPRDQLIVKWAVTTGLRLFEVLGLNQYQIPESKKRKDDSKLIPITVTTTKGGAPRQIYVSLKLLDRTNDYIYEERAAIIRRMRGKGGYVSSAALWLSKNGTALSKGALHKNYSKACKKAGVQATFHDLRHTFAINMLRLLKRHLELNVDTDLNPLKALQKLLGHANISTTEIYLEALHLDMESIEDIVQDVFESLV